MTPNSLPQYHDFHHDGEQALSRDKSEIRDNVRNHHIGKLKKIGATSAIIAEAVIGLYAWDVSVVDSQLAETHASLTPVYGAASSEHKDTMVVVMAGLGNRSAYATAVALPTYDRMGDVEAVTYDNKGVDPESIARLVVQKAAAEGKKSVILDGHSMGGLVATAVAATIYSGDSGLKVKDVILDCTPESFSAVRESQRTTADNTLNMASAVPYSLESRPLRFVAEMIARYRNYVDTASLSVNLPAVLRNAQEIVHDKLLSQDAASGVLIGSQIGMIRKANLANNLRTLGNTDNGKVPPMIFFQQPTEVANDTVVYDDRSRQRLETLTNEDGLRFYTYYTDAGHANPIQVPETYNKIAASIAVAVNEVPEISPNILVLAYPGNTQTRAPVKVTKP